ncbi:MAG: hypothetical protein IKP67_03320 [Spirochaetales bacterium]|nr:hypothetical protein [Spirochaetales bacterium]
MKKFILMFLFLSLMISIYSFLIPVRIHDADYFEIRRAFSVAFDSDNTVDRYTDTPNGYYFTDNSVGYFNTDDGQMVWQYTCPTGEYLTANMYAYVTYREDKTSKFVFSNAGRSICSVATTKIPYFADDLPYFYGLQPDGFGFCKYSLNGERLFDDKNGSSMITTIGGNAEGWTIVSDMSGNTTVYSAAGDVVQGTDSHYSTINFAKTSILSHDNERFAICSGMQPEVMEIFSLKTGTQQYKFETVTNFPHVVMMYMDKDNFYYEGDGSVNRFNMKKNKTYKFGFSGQMCDAKFDRQGNVLILSSESKADNDIYYLNLYSPTGVKYYYREFNMPVDNLGPFDGDSFYFRLNNNIVVCEKTSV